MGLVIKRGRSQTGLWLFILIATTMFLLILGGSNHDMGLSLRRWALYLVGISDPWTVAMKCGNTKQGKHYITDDRAYTCRREDVEYGCCAVRTNRYSCNSCSSTLQCCTEYEFCVSCCMSPSHATSVKDSMRKLAATQKRSVVPNSHLALKTVRTIFDYCSLKCRTSSNSVVFENQYKSNALKFCYGNQDLTPDQLNEHLYVMRETQESESEERQEELGEVDENIES